MKITVELKEFEKISVRVQALAEICSVAENNLRWAREAAEEFESQYADSDGIPEWEQTGYLNNLEKISAYESAYGVIMKAMSK